MANFNGARKPIVFLGKSTVGLSQTVNAFFTAVTIDAA